MAHQGGFGRCLGQHFQRHIGDHTQGTHAAGHDPRHVVASDVFHHLATKGQPLAKAVEHLHAQHMVAHTADIGPGRTRQTASHHAADSGKALSVAQKMRRLKRQALALPVEHRFQLGQRRARTHGDHQFAGLVADDAAVGAGVQHIGAGRGFAIKRFAVAALDAQRLLAGSRLADERLELFDDGRHRTKMLAVQELRHALAVDIAPTDDDADALAPHLGCRL